MKSKEFLFAFVALFLVYKGGGGNIQNTCTSVISTGALTCVAVLPFAQATVNVTGKDDLKPPDRTILKVRSGIDAGRAILDAIKTKKEATFFGRISTIAKKISPFLGAVGTIFGFLDFFIPKGPSLELQYMVKQFTELNQRFDEAYYKLDDVESLIVKEAVKGQYGKYEAMIFSLSERLSKVVEAKAKNLSSEIYEDRKKKFIKEFDKNPLHVALDALYLGLTEKSNLLIDITQSVRTFSFEDRLKVQSMMQNILNLILKGVKVLIAVDLLKGNSTKLDDIHEYAFNTTGHDDISKLRGKSAGGNDTLTEWTAKIKEIAHHMLSVDEIVKNKWLDQMKLDVIKILTLKKELSNKDFADYLYSFLKSKYGWRNWYVVVYNDVSGDDQHFVRKSGAHTWFGVKGRNVIITSDLEGLSKPLDYNFVKMNIQKLHSGYTKTTPWFWGHWTRDIIYDAHELFNFMQKNLKNIPCDNSLFFDMGRGVIKRSADPQYRAPAGHIALVDKGAYRFHVFGHCVHWSTHPSDGQTAKEDSEDD